MKSKSLLVTAIIGIVTLFLAAGLYAGSTVPDVIKMQNDYEHKKGIVEFNHAKHVSEYKAGCGDCHHDENNKPLTDLKAGDDVKKCIECHNKPGEKPKGKGAPKLSKSEELQYHAEALHDNCKGCHKAYNKKNKTKAAPTTCTKCHPKTKKK
jgi:cytochrome c553